MSTFFFSWKGSCVNALYVIRETWTEFCLKWIFGNVDIDLIIALSMHVTMAFRNKSYCVVIY